jgi:hypothetical protein
MSHQLWTTLIKHNVSPNQIYFLDCCRSRIKPTGIINPEAEGIICRAKGYIDENGQLTHKAIVILDEFETFLIKIKKKVATEVLGDKFLEKIAYYRELFPPKSLPSGSMARQSVEELKKKFIVFFKTYPEYNWTLVHLATDYYIFEKEKKGYQFMMNSSYFIQKTDNISKTTKSELADHCQFLLDNPEILRPALEDYKIQNKDWIENSQ